MAADLHQPMESLSIFGVNGKPVHAEQLAGIITTPVTYLTPSMAYKLKM